MNPLRAFRNLVVERMTASHLAGPQLSDAVNVYEEAAGRGWSCTFGYWSGPDDTPKTIGQAYMSAAHLIGEKSLECYLSVKLTAINFDFGFLLELLAVANEHGFRVHCDAMDPTSADPTFNLLERALANYRNLGCTLPGRWMRSAADAGRIVEWGIPVRVVKGQWPDPGLPNFSARVGYLDVVRRLAEKATHVAVATHDRLLARKALQILTENSTPCEMEQLSSLPLNCASLAASHRIPLRLYVPFGHPSMPYDIWQAHVRPQIVGWVLRDALRGRHRQLPMQRMRTGVGQG